MSNARPWPWVARLPTRGETCISWYPLPPPYFSLCPSLSASSRPLFFVNPPLGPFSFPPSAPRRVDQTRRPFATERPARAPRLYQMTANPSSLRARQSILQPVNVASGVLVRDGRRASPKAAQAIVSSPRMLFRAAASRWPDGAPSWPCCRNSIADHPASHHRGQRKLPDTRFGRLHIDIPADGAAVYHRVCAGMHPQANLVVGSFVSCAHSCKDKTFLFQRPGSALPSLVSLQLKGHHL
ncbi:uncharacterized protein J3D65DRAFT_276663 [Phyllosticta citribraziliensis]|uniref:Uncharacterized protein n=1 Tax=Phyllosticta citribraziliensis TaxID=989973 RepID=A0ABR1LX69_9PEZI